MESTSFGFLGFSRLSHLPKEVSGESLSERAVSKGLNKGTVIALVTGVALLVIAALAITAHFLPHVMSLDFVRTAFQNETGLIAGAAAFGISGISFIGLAIYFSKKESATKKASDDDDNDSVASIHSISTSPSGSRRASTVEAPKDLIIYNIESDHEIKSDHESVEEEDSKSSEEEKNNNSKETTDSGSKTYKTNLATEKESETKKASDDDDNASVASSQSISIASSGGRRTSTVESPNDFITYDIESDLESVDEEDCMSSEEEKNKKSKGVTDSWPKTDKINLVTEEDNPAELERVKESELLKKGLPDNDTVFPEKDSCILTWTPMESPLPPEGWSTPQSSYNYSKTSKNVLNEDWTEPLSSAGSAINKNANVRAKIELEDGTTATFYGVFDGKNDKKAAENISKDLPCHFATVYDELLEAPIEKPKFLSVDDDEIKPETKLKKVVTIKTCLEIAFGRSTAGLKEYDDTGAAVLIRRGDTLAAGAAGKSKAIHCCNGVIKPLYKRPIPVERRNAHARVIKEVQNFLSREDVIELIESKQAKGKTFTKALIEKAIQTEVKKEVCSTLEVMTEENILEVMKEAAKKNRKSNDWIGMKYKSEFVQHTLTKEEKGNSFVVMATHELWDVMSQEEVAEYVDSKRAQGKTIKETRNALIKKARLEGMKSEASIIIVSC